MQVSAWKKELQDGLAGFFSSGGAERGEKEKSERDRARLERKVGQLVIVKELLEKSARSSGSI